MKVIPYILTITVLLIAGSIYFRNHPTQTPLVNVSFKKDSKQNTDDANTTDKIGPRFINLGRAPEITGTTGWLNSEPKTLEQLKGSVVLVDFWTYSSINCIRTLPYITKWQEKYADKGFTAIGVHTPEFAFEKVQANIETALIRYNITYPVTLDNNYKTWNAYKNQFWPAQYLIDKEGNIVYTHFGEGNYDETEQAIRTLLGMEGPFDVPESPNVNPEQTSEIYFGLTKLSAFGGSEKPSTQEQIFVYPKKLGKNKFALEGSWSFNQESAVHARGFGRIKLNFNSAKVFMVAQSAYPTTIKVYVDGLLVKGVVVNASELFELYSSSESGQHTMEIEVPDAGFEAFTFTFG